MVIIMTYKKKKKKKETYKADDKDGDDDPLPVARLWIGSHQLLKKEYFYFSELISFLFISGCFHILVHLYFVMLILFIILKESNSFYKVIFSNFA